MKFSTLNKKHPYLAEYWGFTISVDGANNPTKVYSFFRNVPVRMVSDGSGRLFLYTDDGQILKDGQIRKITSVKTGATLVDRLYTISVQEPIIMPLDETISYKYWALEVATA